MIRRRNIACLSIALTAALATVPAFAQPADDPTTQTNPEDGPLTATITAFEGTVTVRPSADDAWVAPTIGMVLPEGAEFRTAPRSAIQFVIPPGQTVTLDRLGVVKLVRANFANGKVNTDLGLKYGRTRFNVETAGREYEATVRTPSSVLAVRGTDFIAFDQPPFAPEGVSLEGRVLFRDIRKQVNVGGPNAGRSKVTTERDSPAQTAAVDATQSGRGGSGSARSTNENQLGLTVTNFLTQPELQVGVFEIFADSQAQATLDSLSVIGVVPNPGQAAFDLFYEGSPNIDVDLVVRSPIAGDVVTVANLIVEGQTATNLSPTGGAYFFDFVFTDATGQDEIAWGFDGRSAPPGVYTIEQTLISAPGDSAAFADTRLVVLNDRSIETPFTSTTNNRLTADQPTRTLMLNLQPLDDTEGGGTVSASSTQTRLLSTGSARPMRVTVLTEGMLTNPIGPHPFVNPPAAKAPARCAKKK